MVQSKRPLGLKESIKRKAVEEHESEEGKKLKEKVVEGTAENVIYEDAETDALALGKAALYEIQRKNFELGVKLLEGAIHEFAFEEKDLSLLSCKVKEELFYSEYGMCFFHLADLTSNSEYFDLALEKLEKALTYSPQDIKILLNIGDSLLKRAIYSQRSIHLEEEEEEE
eukprot:Sdes_comp23581_c0_seq1m21785